MVQRCRRSTSEETLRHYRVIEEWGERFSFTFKQWKQYEIAQASGNQPQAYEYGDRLGLSFDDER